MIALNEMKKNSIDEIPCGSVTMNLLPELVGIKNLLNFLKTPSTLVEKLDNIATFGAHTNPEVFDMVIRNWLVYCGGLKQETGIDALIFLAKLGQFVDVIFTKIDLSEHDKADIFAYWIEIGRFDLLKKFGYQEEKQKNPTKN